MRLEEYARAMSTSQVPLPATVQFAPDYPIETERLLLRPFSRGDVDAVFSYRSRADVAEYLFDPPMNHAECAEAVRLRVAQIAFIGEGDKIVLAVERREDGRMIGEVSLIWRSVADLQGEVGYIFHPDAHGRGYAAEDLRTMRRPQSRVGASDAEARHARRGAFPRAHAGEGPVGRRGHLRNARP
jgi:RimJ/RimL family protein N-acetyltransferase